MKLAYVRVSTVKQDYTSQVEALEKAGYDKLFEEKVTGTSTAQRKALQQMLSELRPGDEVIVYKIDRLARSIIDLNKIVTEIKEKGASIRFISENMEFKANENNSLQALLFNVLGSFAQFERDIIVERTSEGRERAKAKGKHMGRKGQPKKEVKRALSLYNEREQNGLSVADIVKMTNVPKSTIYHELKKQGANDEDNY
jgi:DNA invertase Pin-like site-specific DNA recombinase